MFWFAMLMVIVVPGVLALVFGSFAFRSRVTGVYLSIITQALTFALLLDVISGIRLDVMPVVFASLLSAIVGIALSADREAVRAVLAGVHLKRREALISSVLSASIDGIIVFGRDGVVQDANVASAKLLGRANESLHGENVCRLLPGIFELDTLDAGSRVARGGAGDVRPDYWA
jgi:PAS domain-containing protein